MENGTVHDGALKAAAYNQNTNAFRNAKKKKTTHCPVLCSKKLVNLLGFLKNDRPTRGLDFKTALVLGHVPI